MLQFDFGLIKLVGFASGPKPFLLTRPLQAAVSAIIFFASTFCHETVLKETALALRAEGFEAIAKRQGVTLEKYFQTHPRDYEMVRALGTVRV
jgi:hypothetical protein